MKTLPQEKLDQIIDQMPDIIAEVKIDSNRRAYASDLNFETSIGNWMTLGCDYHVELKEHPDHYDYSIEDIYIFDYDEKGGNEFQYDLTPDQEDKLRDLIIDKIKL